MSYQTAPHPTRGQTPPHPTRDHPALPRPSTPRPSTPRPTTPKPAKPSSTRTSRLAWLDALRGIAALFVVFDHLTAYVLQPVNSAVLKVFDPGLFGVLLFFLISGYIVPASLERKGSIRSFWISRVFRLFPLYFTVIGAVLVLHGFGHAAVRGTQSNVTASTFAHLFMLGDLLGGSDLINVLWTLAYEMVFYLLLTALFTLGWHKRSGRLAVTMAAGALVLGGILPNLWLSRSSLQHTRVAIGADVLILVGLALAVAGNRMSRTAGACLAGLTGLTLLLVNERQPGYEGLTILAVMFTGTMLFRAERGQIDRRRAALIAVGVFIVVIAAGLWHITQTNDDIPLRQHEWLTSVAAAGLTFAAGLALRNRRVPSVLAWLGLISYSIYLVHPVLIYCFHAIPGTPGPHPLWLQLLMVAGFFAVLIPVCAVTYYLVEAPMQRLGRRITRRLDARFGPDRLPVRADRLPAGAQTT
jgi:peptidoglycan/LPS O-acetylase OafA/YrhL